MRLCHKRSMAISNETNRAKPNGYICQQFVEKTSGYLGEVLSDLSTVVNVNLPKEEIYRLVARVIDKVHRADESNETVREICTRRGN